MPRSPAVADDAASTSGTAECATSPAGSRRWKSACSRLTRADAARALGAEPERLEHALTGAACDT